MLKSTADASWLDGVGGGIPLARPQEHLRRPSLQALGVIAIPRVSARTSVSSFIIAVICSYFIVTLAETVTLHVLP